MSNCCITYTSYNFDGAAVLELVQNAREIPINLLGATVGQENGFFVLTDLRNNVYKINDNSGVTFSDVQQAITITHSGGSTNISEFAGNLFFNASANNWRNTTLFPSSENIRTELSIQQVFVRNTASSYLVFSNTADRDYFTANAAEIGMKINGVLLDPSDLRDNNTAPRIFIEGNTNTLLRATFPVSPVDGEGFLTTFTWTLPTVSGIGAMQVGSNFTVT